MSERFSVPGRRCSLWIHDDAFSREVVVLGAALLSEEGIRTGDLAQIEAVECTTADRDFQDPPTTTVPEHLRARTKVEAAKDSDGRRVGRASDSADPAAKKPQHGVVSSLSPAGKTAFTFIVKDAGEEHKVKHPSLEISLAASVANAFGFKHRTHVILSKVDKEANTAEYVELVFRDEYLARSDMWHLTLSELCDRTVHKEEKILFMGTIKAQIKQIYVDGRQVTSAYFSADTKPIFRSESARYVLLLQMSKEMWEFDSDASGEILFNKMINGLLPDLFHRWTVMNARHLVTVVLFTRVYYSKGTTPYFTSDNDIHQLPTDRNAKADKKRYKDFYRVVVSEMASGDWAAVLDQLKKEFKVFRRDISIQKTSPAVASKRLELGLSSNDADVPSHLIAGQPSAAIHGNVLEAICLASLQYSTDYIDRDLVRTGISVVLVTPGPGLFEVEYPMLKTTTDNLISNGIGIDLVCLGKMPLHSVPLFRYRTPDYLGWETDPLRPANDSGGSTPCQTNFGPDSLSGRFAAVSPAKTSQLGASLHGSSPIRPRAGDWSHVIPHWMDVSYWPDATTALMAAGVKRDGLPVHANLHNRSDSIFLPRIKIYELQMMGIMENEMSNISIPYLHESAFHPLQPRTYERGTSKRVRLEARGHTDETADARSPRHVDLERISGGSSSKISEHGHAFAKIVRDRAMPKQDKEDNRWMDDYDESAFRPLSELRASERKSRAHKAGIMDAEAVHDASAFGTSYVDHSRSPRGLNIPEGTAYFDRKMKERYQEQEQQTTAGRVSQAPPSTVRKRIWSSHHLSSGFRKLSGAPPKATASTELRTENVIYDPLPGQQGSPARAPTASTLPHRAQLTPARPGSPGALSIDGRDEVDAKGQRDAAIVPSRPIAIKTALSTPEKSQAAKNHSGLGTIFDGVSKDIKQSEKLDDVWASSSFTKRSVLSVDQPQPNTPGPSRHVPHRLSPWLTLVHPSNPHKTGRWTAKQLGRWQHVFPRPILDGSMKWKSLCSPAAIPFTTEAFPSASELAHEYQESPYRILRNDDDDELQETAQARDNLIKELIALRLTQGFQLVVGPAVVEAVGRPTMSALDLQRNRRSSGQEDAMVYMSKGDIIHQLQCVEGGEVEVKRFVRKQSGVSADSETPSRDGSDTTYKARIRSTLAEGYEARRVNIQASPLRYNWNYADSFVAGYEDEFTEHLRFWRARFVLIPVDQPQNTKRPLYTLSEDNDEEIRLEGIRKLTQMWQRHRYVPPEERHFQSPLRSRKDTNPLDIVYQTRDPSSVVAAELDTLPLAEGGSSGRRVQQLLADKELLQRSDVNLATLAQEIQGEKGVPMRDRRWHLRTHYNCFIGFEMTTWLLSNFRDVETRDDAVDFGNELMKSGLFDHVEKRHRFRDGNYFYQIKTDYRSPRPDSRRSWFGGKRPERASVPPTPASDASTDLPRADRPRSVSNHNNDNGTSANTGNADGSEEANGAGAGTGASESGVPKKVQVVLSKVMKYDVDPRKKSYRTELINLHYDRLHNPDNCYHIRIDWMNVTAKLIEDAIVSWATIADKFGLKLVEIPISEASLISDRHPFRAPYVINLATPPPPAPVPPPPPLQPPTIATGDMTSQTLDTIQSAQVASQPQRADHHVYQRAIMKKFNFVLDIEAKTNFPRDVDVVYSWGRPDYRYSQYIHRSGVVLAQIRDDGSFLLLANRLYNNRTAANPDKFERADPRDSRGGGGGGSAAQHAASYSPISSPLVRAAPDTAAMAASTSSVVGLALDDASATPALIKAELEHFCRDPNQLQRFYDAHHAKMLSPVATSTDPSSALDGSIPTLGLPPSITARESSPSPSPIPSLSGGGGGGGSASDRLSGSNSSPRESVGGGSDAVHLT